MYMHITLTTGETVKEFCHGGSYGLKDAVLTVYTNADGDWVSYPLYNVVKFHVQPQKD